MPAKPLQTVHAPTAEEWRRWLAAHHASETEIWLLFYKRETGRPGVSYSDALDEALCFGWIDSLVKRLDDNSYARKFTPRKAESNWSTVNRNRYAALQAAGRLHPAGMERAPTARSGDAPRPEFGDMPEYIQSAFRAHPAAWTFFQSLAPSYRRLYLAWIDSAKQPATKARRLEEALALLAAGKKLGLK